MSTATFTHTTGLRPYLADVAAAARAFAAALFAAQERQFVVQEVAPKRGISPRALFKSRIKLESMARDYDRLYPSLAGELRNLAGRD